MNTFSGNDSARGNGLLTADGGYRGKVEWQSGWVSTYSGRVEGDRLEGTTEARSAYGRCTGNWWLSPKS